MEHAENVDFWTEVFSIAVDPAHMVAELISAIVIDLIVVALMYNILFKKFILPAMKAKLAKEIHEEIDVEHGYIHQHTDNKNSTKN